MKRALRTLSAVALTLSLALSSALASGLSPIRDYESSGFTDVSGDWSRPYIETCYELGLMSGKGAGLFAPAGDVSLAEAVAVSARVRDLWNGGTGEFPEIGGLWYGGSLAYAVEQGIVKENQFTDFDRPATRAELAGLLAKALPEDEYTPLNDIAALPDVAAATPYSQDIFTLYNAGVLTGGDAYGTFSPGATITRAELSAILCRLVQPGTRKAFALQEKPQGPATAYTTDKLLWLANAPLAGMVVIEGEYYFPLELLQDKYRGDARLPLQYRNWQGGDEPFTLKVSSYVFENATSLTLMAPTMVVQEGKALGETLPAAQPLELALPGYEYVTIPGAVRTLDGLYPMVRLSALADYTGYKDDGKSIVLFQDHMASCPVTWEADLAGQAAATLVKGGPHDTALAYHDYLVNSLIYDNLSEFNTSEAAIEAHYDRAAQLREQYRYSNNITLAWGYGVCADYSALYQAMCVQAGIPCRYVTGDSTNGPHAWNQVFLDGKWSYVDVTWDDPIGAQQTLRYTYFLVDAERMMRDHCWDGPDYTFPTEYDPAWEQIDPNRITTADEYRKCIVAQVMQRKTSFSLRPVSNDAYGGHGVLFNFTVWSSLRGGYNSATGAYDYTVQYW